MRVVSFGRDTLIQVAVRAVVPLLPLARLGRENARVALSSRVTA